MAITKLTVLPLGRLVRLFWLLFSTAFHFPFSHCFLWLGQLLAGS